jgi:hypothetical protein
MFEPTSNYHTSIAGEFAVLSQLSLKGYDANLTVGRAKSVDILVSDPTTGQMYRLEVKTNWQSSRSAGGSPKLFGKYVSAWIMNVKHETISDPLLFYCFVNISPDAKTFRFFVVPSHVVSGYVKAQHQLWLKANHNHSKENKMRTFRIGTATEKYPILTPCIEQWENNWEFRYEV